MQIDSTLPTPSPPMLKCPMRADEKERVKKLIAAAETPDEKHKILRRVMGEFSTRPEAAKMSDEEWNALADELLGG